VELAIASAVILGSLIAWLQTSVEIQNVLALAFGVLIARW